MKTYNIYLIFLSFLFVSNQLLAQNTEKENVKIIEKETTSFSSLRTDVSYTFTEIESVDANGAKLRLLSETNTGVALSYTEHWDNQNTTSLKLGYNSLNFKNPDSSNVENTKLSLMSFGFGHTYSFNKKFRVHAGIYWNEEVYIRAKNTNLLTLDKFLNPSVKTDAELDFVEINNFKLGSSLSVEVSAPFTAERYETTEGNYAVDPALATGACIYARKFLNGYSIEGNVFYKNKKAKTSITEQTTVSQGIGLRLAIPFGY